MRTDEFTDEPQDDPLQLAGDVALSALRGALRGFGIDEDDYSAVISLQHDEHAATVLHLPGGPSAEDYALFAFRTQLMHTLFSARALGLDLRVVNVGSDG